MEQNLIDEMLDADNPDLVDFGPYEWSPKEIEEWIHTDGGIAGQDAAVRAAAMTIYNHYDGRASVSLFAGPTGSGKTEIWRALQREYGPQNIVIVDASTLSPEGWKGSNKLSAIFASMDSDVKRNHVILVLDEADKIIEPVYGSGGTNYSDIIQNQLLRICDHDTLLFSCGDDSGKTKSLSIDCSNVSVVMLGAFSRLYEKKTYDRKCIGFGCGQAENVRDETPEITVEDLIAYGMRAELAGRISRIVCLKPLSVRDLSRIGQAETRRLSAILRRPVSISPDALIMLARTAQHKGLGARWVKSRIGQILDDMVYEDPYADEYVVGYGPSDADERRPTGCATTQPEM